MVSSFETDTSHNTNVPVLEETLDSTAITRESPIDTSGCEAQGIGTEEEFARKVCTIASEFGFRAELVHSYGAGGVDLFISEADATDLRSDQAKLRSQTAALTAWAKQNYSAFNAVEVAIVGGDSKIAVGSILGDRAAKIELF